MKSLMTLWRAVANEFGDLCDVSTTRDIETVSSRFEDEGFSFFAITLPAFCDDLQKALADGAVAPDMFRAFAHGHAGLPRFLGGFLELIFDCKSGVLLADPNIDAIHAIRQLTLLYGKTEMPTSDKRNKAALKGFVECEQEVRKFDQSVSSSELADFSKMSNLLWSDVLQSVENDLYTEWAGSDRENDPRWPYVIPRHGPGATADRNTGNSKFDLKEWPQRLESVFPYGEYALPNWRYNNRLDRIDFLEPGAERPVRVVLVPKTLKTPRIIAVEPTAMQYMQQALKAMLVRSIQGDKALGEVVGFDDQWRNNLLASLGSIDGSFATLDLSEASDRVSNQLVRIMLNPFPHLFEGVDATRSRKADVPGYGILRLAKFASMGSALTFPVEAMVFTTVVYLGIQKSYGHRLSRREILALRGKVRIFGDDIIVPGDTTLDVMAALRTYGFVVSPRKSFWTGKFRESCGKEYYAGHDVSVVRVRKLAVLKDGSFALPNSRRFVRETESLVSLRNRFYLSGLWTVAAWLDDWIEPLLGGHYPVIEVQESGLWNDQTSRSQLLGRWSVLPKRISSSQEWRINPDFHSLEVRGWVTSHQIPSSKVSGVGALQKVLSPERREPFEDIRHLEQAGRPQSAHMTLRWIHYHH